MRNFYHYLYSVIFLFPLALSVIACDRRDKGSAKTFVVAMDAPPKGLDPRYATSDGSAKLVGLIHAGLVSVDNDKGVPRYELAESITQPNLTTYEITLKPNLTFHDGSPLTAEDVKFTFTTLDNKDVRSPYGAISRRIKSIEIKDARHLTITLKEPHSPFITDLSFGIVPKRLCEGVKICRDGGVKGRSIGAGPFKFVSRDNNDVTLAAFENYVGGAPRIKRALFKVIPNENTRLIALLGNSVDLAQNGVSPLMLPVVEKNDKLNIFYAPSFRYTYLAFNLDNPILKNKKVRKAIAYGINRPEIINYKFRGHAQLATGMLAPSHWAYNGNVETYSYDPERAKKLLDEAGFPDPDGDGPLPRFTIEFKISSSKFRKSLAELIAYQLRKIGIEVTIKAFEWGTFYGDIASRNFEMTTLQWPSVLEPSLYRWIFHSSNIPTAKSRWSGANRGGYRNPKIDQLLDEAMATVDEAKQKEIYGEVQAILAESLPYVSLWHEDNIAVVKKRVNNYKMTPNARFEYLKETVVND